MNSSCKSRGITVVEVLVTSALFGLILTMVARAMIMGHHSQRTVSHKLDIVRQASMALDLIVRDVEAARYYSRVRLLDAYVTPLPSTPTSVSMGKELRVDRFQETPGSPLTPETVSVGYWYVPGPAGEPEKGTLQRTMYQDWSTSGATSPFANGYTAQGRTLVRDVREFLVSSSYDSTLGHYTVTASLQVGNLGKPIEAAVTAEGI